MFFSTIFQWISDTLKAYPEAFGVALGLLFSWGATQRVKFMLPATWPTPKYKAVVRAVATVTAFAFCYGTWEAIDHLRADNVGAERPLAAIISIGVALASPIIYTYTLKALVHFWPWIDDKVSGRPGE
jgi:hypothetical protein